MKNHNGTVDSSVKRFESSAILEVLHEPGEVILNVVLGHNCSVPCIFNDASSVRNVIRMLSESGRAAFGEDWLQS